MCVLLLLQLAPWLMAENIRGKVVGISGVDALPVSFRTEEIVIIEVDAFSHYLEGLELRIDIPDALRQYRNSFALLIFKNVQPEPAMDQLTYTGERAYMRLIPSRDSMFFRIPFVENHEFLGDALTEILPVPLKSDVFPLLITVIPVLKGIPDEAFSQNFSISTSPLLKNAGELDISIVNLSGDADEVVNVTVNGKEIDIDVPVTVEAGVHNVRITSTHASTVEKSIPVERGQKIELPIILDYGLPEITVQFPDGARILFDDEPMELVSGGATVQVTPGEHEIAAIIGDLRISRQFFVKPGAKIGIKLLLDIEISEYNNN